MRRPRPLCAICADREATTITDWECESGATRTVVACWPCLSPVPDPPEEYEPADLAARVRDRATAPPPARPHLLRDAVLQVVRARGEATTAEIRADLAFHTEAEQNHITVVLSRLVKAGALTAEELVPGAPTNGRIYRPTGEPPISPAVAAQYAAVAAAPDEFNPIEVGLSPTALGMMRAAGLVERVRLARTTTRGGLRVTMPSLWRKTGKPLPRTRAA